MCLSQPRRLPLLLALAFACPAYADTDQTPEKAEESTALEEVVVTGERSKRSGFATGTSHKVFTTPDIDRSCKVARLLSQFCIFFVIGHDKSRAKHIFCTPTKK